MFKNIIIGVLLLLLTLTVYYYISLSYSMEEFQKKRIENIIAKENDIKLREKELIEKETCNTELNKCSKIISDVKNIISS